jgi:CrcB protein
MNKILLVLIGGGIGSLARYGTTLLAGKTFGPGFPWGTLAVNLTGCFLIGISLALAERSAFMPPHVRLFFVTGFLGGLTTFSSYALESVVAARGGLFPAAANILANNVAGLALVFLGAKLTERILL